MFFGFAVVYGLRVNLSVAMVAMVNGTSKQSSPSSNISNECPVPHHTLDNSSQNSEQPDGVRNSNGMIFSNAEPGTSMCVHHLNNNCLSSHLFCLPGSQIRMESRNTGMGAECFLFWISVYSNPGRVPVRTLRRKHLSWWRCAWDGSPYSSDTTVGTVRSQMAVCLTCCGGLWGGLRHFVTSR